MFVLAITSDTRMIGIIAIESHAEFFDYQLLRDHISTSVKVVALHEQAVKQTALHERSVQERIATAERMRSLSVLSGGVAHDLNNALGSLVALSDVVLDELDERRRNPQHDESELRADLVAIKSGALRAAETVKDLMTLGRRGRTSREPLDLNQLVQRCVRDVRMQLPADRVRPVQVRVEPSAAPMTILGSEAHLVRAVGNLIHNAIEAVGQDGTITVRTDALSLPNVLCLYEDVPAGEYVTVTVSDTGPGIAAEHLNKVFEPFFTTKKLRETSGSGLGLSIVHSVVKEHEGYLAVASHLGHGTTFTLYFPRINNNEVVVSDSEPSLIIQGRAKILVVDDDPIQLRVASRVLGRLGYEVTVIASGMQAYQLLCDRAEGVTSVASTSRPTTSAFDVLILDMALNEEQSGLEVFHRIREKFPDQKGVLASGHSFMQEEQQATESGLIWLSKPYTATSLSQAVQSQLSPQMRPSSKPPQ
jgi:signal transduction histidine kinase/ActR/RegA family two-component response regulator